jgi:hypothetical protein
MIDATSYRKTMSRKSKRHAGLKEKKGATG